MSLKVNGMNDVLRELDKLYGTSAQINTRKKAVKKGGDFMVKKLKSEMSSFSDTGLSVHETNLYGPNNDVGFTNAKINWQGATERYRIIHLNEYGHYDRAGKWVNTRGKGVIENTIKNNEGKYFNILKDEVKRRV